MAQSSNPSHVVVGFFSLATAGALVTVFTWGGTPIITKFGVESVDVLSLALLRTVAALPLAVLILAALRCPLPWRGNQKEEPEYEERDSESIVRVPETGEYWISFENRSSLRRYSPDLSRELETIRPKAMKRWPSNGGGEALARLADGRFILIAEYGEAKGGGYEGLIWPGQPSAKVEPQRFAYLPPEGFHATDAKVLPDGRLLVLNRRLAFPTGLSAALTVIDGDAIRPGARVRGTLLAKLESPLAVDNMEALAVTQEGGQNIVWIASDDNFNAFQRTLLMKFALPKEPSATTGPGFDSLN